MKKKTTHLLILALFCGCISSVSAKTIYANAANGNDANDGTTAETAVQTVSKAYTLAVDGDVIKLDGTFLFESQIVLDKALTIESAGADKAVLDGQSTTRFFTFQKDVTLRNLVLRNGYNTSDEGGGAIYKWIAYWIKMNIINCVFDGNVSTKQGGALRILTYGGTDDLLKIDRCVFKNNQSNDHGGVLSFINEGGSPGNGATLVISNSTFTGNKNNGGAGGILFAAGGALNYGTYNFINITATANSDYQNPNGNLPGFVFIGSNMAVNVINSVIEGNQLQNGYYADFSFDNATPAALTIKNSIVGHITNYGATIDPANFTAIQSTVNNSKYASDALLSGLGAFNGSYFPLTSLSLAYDYGRTPNVPVELKTDQSGSIRANGTYSSAGAVNFYQDVTTGTENLGAGSNYSINHNSITIKVNQATVEIYNVTGSLVHTSMVNGSKTIQLSPGVYILKSITTEKKSVNKFILN